MRINSLKPFFFQDIYRSYLVEMPDMNIIYFVDTMRRMNNTLLTLTIPRRYPINVSLVWSVSSKCRRFFNSVSLSAFLLANMEGFIIV